MLKDLFASGRIECFLGYQKGTVKFKSAPLIARGKEDLPELAFDDFSPLNLTFYLKEIKGKVGILVKGCDSRSLISLIKEGQIKREELYIIGLPCPGQIDLKKVALVSSGEMEEVREIIRQGEDILIRCRGEEKKIPLPQVLLRKGLSCFYPKPLICDALLTGTYVSPVKPEGPHQEEMAPKTISERWAFWSAQFARCLRCYAWRNICPPVFAPAVWWRRICQNGFPPSPRRATILFSI